MKKQKLSSDIMIFFRKEGFYPVQAVKGKSLADQASEHAALNPGTMRVEDQHGHILWSLQ